MDILDKNKNENVQIRDRGKTIDAAIEGQYSNKKNTDEKPIASLFSTSIHFPSATTTSSYNDNKLSNNNTSYSTTKPANTISTEPKNIEDEAHKWWSISPIGLKSEEPSKDYKDNKVVNSNVISKTMNDIAKSSAPIDAFSTDAKNNEKPSYSDKLSIPIKRDNEKIKPEASIPTESRIAEKTAKKWWSIFSSDKKSEELPKAKDDKEKKIINSDVVSKTMNDIAKNSSSVNVASTLAKNKEEPLGIDKPSISIQKNNEKTLTLPIQQKNNEKVEIKPSDFLSVKPKITEKPAKKWWSIFSIGEESQKPPKDNKDEEKKIVNSNVTLKTTDDIEKSSMPTNFSLTSAKDNYKTLDNKEPLIPIQKDNEKIKSTDADVKLSDTTIKTADKILSASSPSPFGNFTTTIAKENDKPSDNDKLSVPIKKDIEKPLIPIQRDNEKIKPEASIPTESRIAEKTAKKWWSIFSSDKKSEELPKAKDDKEKKIINSDVVSKTINDVNEFISPNISIDGNEIIQSNTDKEISKERPKFNTKEPCIKVEQLRVIYNKGKSNEVRSLDGVDVEIYPEEYIIIFGPSGCGKSTLLYGISGLQAPTYGDVTVLGKNLSQMTKREKVEFHQTKIGMVFQAFYLIETLTVLDNVCLPKVFRGEPLKERREKAMDLLRRFGIAEQADKFPAQLSGGQKQRVSVARALVNNPDIILADEPVGNLDSESAQNVLDIFKEINEVDKKTLILVTHNPEHLVYADRIIHMKDGKKVREEINTDKRPKEALEKDISITPEEISSELKLLMRTFKNLSLQQIGVLLIPFKAKQLINHILAALKEEQIAAAENFLKDLLFKNIDNENFEKKLDLDLAKGGAGWNKLRAISFTHRVQEILEQAEILREDGEMAIITLTDYLIKLYNLKVDAETLLRFRNFVKLRVENKIDRFGLQQRIDAPKALGGVGLYKGSAEKVVDEIELIMLLKYSEQQ